MLIPNEHLETPHYTIDRFKSTESHPYRLSYEAKQRIEPNTEVFEKESSGAVEVPAVGHLPASAPAPSAQNSVSSASVPVAEASAPDGGWLKRLWSTLFGKSAEVAVSVGEPAPAKSEGRREREDRRNRSRKERAESRHSRSSTGAEEVKAVSSERGEAAGNQGSRRPRRERPPRGERPQASPVDNGVSVEQSHSTEVMAEKTQAEIQAMSRAAMDRINAKVDEAIRLPEPPTPAAEDAPRRSARAERMARSDRWERQMTAEPAPMPVHHAETHSALLAAQDAAADSLMGNRAQRHHASEGVASVTETATPAPTSAPSREPVMVEPVKPVFEIKHEAIEQTKAADPDVVSVPAVVTPAPTPVSATVTADVISESVVDGAVSSSADAPTSYEPRRPMRRGLYRRRVVGNRKPRRSTDEHAVADFAQSADHSHDSSS